MNSSVHDYVDISKSEMRNKNVLITGSTSGIGRKAAIALGEAGCNLYVHGRNKERGRSLVKKLRNDIGTKAHFFRADFSNLNETRSLPARVKDEVDHIDILVNNAGGFFRHDSKVSEFEYTFVVNHLSPLIVSLRMLPLLRKSDNPKIIFTASDAHRFIENSISYSAVNSKTNNWRSYCRSKSFNIMSGRILDRKLENINVCSLHPGAIPSSGFYRNLPLPISKIGKIVDYIPIGTSTYEGAGMILYAINNKKDDINGTYYSDFSIEKPSSIVQDRNNQEKLWNISTNAMSLDYGKFIKND